MSAVAMRRSSSTSGSSGASSARYSTKIVAVAADVEAHVDEARLRRRCGPVVVDDREDLEPVGVRQLGVELVRVDEREEVDRSRPPSRS